MKKRNIALLLSLVMLMSVFLFGCGSSSKYESAPAPAADSYNYAMAPAEAPAAVYEERAEMDMAGGFGGIASASTTAAENGSSSSAQFQSEKIIYSANAQIEAIEFDKALEGVYAMVERFGGFIESSSISGSNYYRSARGLKTLRSADFTLRIPSEHFEELTGSLSELGNVPYCNTYTENVTAQYYDVQSRMDAYKIQEARLLEMLAIAETVDDMLSIQQQLTEVQYQIDSMKSRLTNYDRRVNYSTVNLTVSEVEQYTEAPVVHLSYWETMQQNFDHSLQNVKDFFVDASLWVGGNLPELICWIIGLALVIGILKRIFGKKGTRKERRAEKKAARAAAKEAKAAEKAQKKADVPTDAAPSENEENKAE